MSTHHANRDTTFSTLLDGVRVLDLSQYISGPLASLILSDMGSDVLKVEPPHGDGMRALGPRDHEGGGLFHRCINAGKRVVRLDLKQREDHALLLSLVEDADVLLEGFRPGVMQRLGLDYPRLKRRNPRLIYCAISGYGATSYRANRAGHDANYLAEAGVLDRNGTERPIYFDPPVADMSAALYAAVSLIAALYRRTVTGAGCYVDLALADVAMPLQQFQIAHFGHNGYEPKRGQTYLNAGAAYYNIYKTADGEHIVIGAVEEKFWHAFCQAAQRPQWIARQSEPIPQTSLIADVAARIGEFTAAECDQRFEHANCCYCRVVSLGEALSSKHVTQRKLVGRGGDQVLQSLFPAWVDGEPPVLRTPMREMAVDALPKWRTR